VSVREAEGITDIAEQARWAESYNRLYASALPMARAGDQDTLDLYFEAIAATLKDAETQYNYAVSEGAADAVEKGVTFSEALID
jgi:hypothetical protein